MDSETILSALIDDVHMLQKDYDVSYEVSVKLASTAGIILALQGIEESLEAINSFLRHGSD